MDSGSCWAVVTSRLQTPQSPQTAERPQLSRPTLVLFDLCLQRPQQCRELKELSRLFLLCLSSGYSKKVPWTAWLINHRNLSPQFWRLGSLRSGCQHSRVLVRALFWVADFQLLTVFSHGGERARELSGVLFIRALISFMKAPPS